MDIRNVTHFVCIRVYRAEYVIGLYPRTGSRRVILFALYCLLHAHLQVILQDPRLYRVGKDVSSPGFNSQDKFRSR
jgi:hypothetical protein